jgi:hypothetical protein
MILSTKFLNTRKQQIYKSLRYFATDCILFINFIVHLQNAGNCRGHNHNNQRKYCCLFVKKSKLQQIAFSGYIYFYPESYRNSLIIKNNVVTD